MGNLYLPLLQISNTYAFGRLSQNPNEKPETILADFAGHIAHKADKAKLADILIWLENHSYWQEQMPADGKLPNLPNTLTHAQAVEIARTIRPNPKPKLPFPIAPEMWLTDLRRSLDKMDWA